MSTANHNPALSKPRWDGSRFLFEIEVGGEIVRCAISRSALQDISGRRQFAAAELLRSFMDTRARIEAMAVRKFNAQTEGATGIVSIWADDLDDAPMPPATPALEPSSS